MAAELSARASGRPSNESETCVFSLVGEAKMRAGDTHGEATKLGNDYFCSRKKGQAYSPLIANTHHEKDFSEQPTITATPLRRLNESVAAAETR